MLTPTLRKELREGFSETPPQQADVHRYRIKQRAQQALDDLLLLLHHYDDYLPPVKAKKGAETIIHPEKVQELIKRYLAHADIDQEEFCKQLMDLLGGHNG